MSIQFDNVSFAYTAGSPLLNNLAFDTVPGECLLIVGHNGAGKSTILKLLNGIMKPNSGRVVVFGKDTARSHTAELARDVSVTFQNPGDQIFARTVFDEARFGPRALNRKDPDALARAALALCGLTRSEGKHPYDLSAPERKLLTVASAVASGARVLAFDEPSVTLSQPERRTLEHALRTLRSEGRTLIIVSHDLGFFVPMADRILVLQSASPALLFPAPKAATHENVLRRAGVRFPYADRLVRIVRRSGRIRHSHRPPPSEP